MTDKVSPKVTKKVVVVTTLHWATTSRLCMSLAKAGFHVTALTPADHALRNFSCVTALTIGRTTRDALGNITRALQDIIPDMVIPADERAIDLLRLLYTRAIGGKGRRSLQLAMLLEASLGTPSAFMFASQKSYFIELARHEGLLVPDTTAISDVDQLRLQLRSSPFPVVLKRDGSCGGLGVRVASNRVEAEKMFYELRAATGPLAASKQAVKKLDVGYLDRSYRHRRVISLQQFIQGAPANRAVVCHRGQVLAGLSVQVLQTSSPTGPASVVRAIESQEMKDAAAHLVARLGLSGFVGFDFMIEASTGRPYLLEMNGRPTQICHLKVDASSDMIGALAANLSAIPVPDAATKIGRDIVALFPQEIWRDANSPHLKTAFHDVPQDMPEFVAAYIRPVSEEPADWTQILRRSVQRARRSAPSISPLQRAPGEELQVPGGV